MSGTTRVSRYQKGKTTPDFTEARDGEWQWHQLGRMQVCTSLQADIHASTPPLINMQNVLNRVSSRSSQPTGKCRKKIKIFSVRSVAVAVTKLRHGGVGKFDADSLTKPEVDDVTPTSPT